MLRINESGFKWIGFLWCIISITVVLGCVDYYFLGGKDDEEKQKVRYFPFKNAKERLFKKSQRSVIVSWISDFNYISKWINLDLSLFMLR